MEKQFFEFFHMEFELPGMTVGIGRLEPIKKGWVVKVKNLSNFEGEEGMNKAINAAVQTSNKLSGYKDGETELWDVIEVFDNESEATEFGKVNEQMTIYQIETGKLKWIN